MKIKIFSGLMVIVLTCICILVFQLKVVDGNSNVEILGWEPNIVKETNYYYVNILEQPVILPDIFCNSSINTNLLLIFVHSSPGNFEKRVAIRETWGNKTKLLQENSTLFFLLGKSGQPRIENNILLESQMFDDLIQMDFDDTYNNLTLKSISMLKLVASKCVHQPQFVLKIDDDSFVNVPKLGKILRGENGTEFLAGRLNCWNKPHRNPLDKNFAPYYLYPSTTYPRYVAGGAYLMKTSTLQKLFYASVSVPLFHIEDVYVTGLCALEAGIQPQHTPLFSKGVKKISSNYCDFYDISILYDLTMREIKLLQYFLSAVDRINNCKSKDEKIVEFRVSDWIISNFVKFSDNPFNYRNVCK